MLNGPVPCGQYHVGRIWVEKRDCRFPCARPVGGILDWEADWVAGVYCKRHAGQSMSEAARFEYYALCVFFPLTVVCFLFFFSSSFHSFIVDVAWYNRKDECAGWRAAK